MHARFWYYARIGIVNFITGAIKAIELARNFWINFSYRVYEQLYNAVKATIAFATATAHAVTRVHELDPKECLQNLTPIMMEYAQATITKNIDPGLVYQTATKVDQYCEQSCWLLLSIGAARDSLRKCPFTNPQVYLKAASGAQGPFTDILAEAAGALGAALGLAASVILRETAYYLMLMERAKPVRAAALAWAYANAGQEPGTDPPPHLRTVENFAHQQTLDAFQEFADTFNQLIEEYGGGHLPTFPGPPLVAIQGFKLDCPDLEEVAEYFGENFRETVRNWLNSRINRFLGRY